MRNFSVRFLLIALVCFTLTVGQHLSYNQLRRLYNTRVRHAQKYKRPIGSSSDLNLPAWIPHAGVVVTTADGGRWLVHKGSGDEYDSESQTIVTQASHMSYRWRPVGARKWLRYSTVGDFVAAGRENYNLLFDNCLHAASRMMRLN